MVAPIVLLLGCVAMLVGGGVILYRGLRLRRAGDAPYCADCNYNLTGLDSTRCPECGAPLSEETIVRGEGHRRPILVCGGCLLVMSALVSFVAFARPRTLTPYLPTAVLIRMLESSRPSRVQDALLELETRDATGRLSKSQRSQLVDSLLSLLADSSWELNWLERLYLAGAMSRTQEKTFFNHVRLRVEVRPKIAVGEPIYVEWFPHSGFLRGRQSGNCLWLFMSEPEFSLDGVRADCERLPGPTTDSAFAPSPHSGRCIVRVPQTARPSRYHRVTFEQKYKVFYGIPGREDKSWLCYEGAVSAKDRLRILPPDETRSAAPIDDPSPATELSKLFSVTLQACPQGVNGPEQSLRITCGSVPVGVAFRAFVRNDDKEREVGEFACRVFASRSNIPAGLWRHEGPLPKTVDVVLRADKDVALHSLSVFKYWDGELVFKDVPADGK
ncbi:MAG: hypothetical protein JXQ73_15220 [Phycisphaerae bacterium]|nr:hypothetical protein [Phycisphaerae bacterium]